MKKKSILIIGSICFMIAIGGVYTKSNAYDYFSETMLTNIDALASSGDAVAPSDTGKAEMIDCAGPFSGSKKECMCTNTNPCTPSSCK